MPETQTVRAWQLHRDDRIVLMRGGKRTVYRIERLVRDRVMVRFDARPVSRTGRLWNGRVHASLAVLDQIERLAP